MSKEHLDIMENALNSTIANLTNTAQQARSNKKFTPAEQAYLELVFKQVFDLLDETKDCFEKFKGSYYRAVAARDAKNAISTNSTGEANSTGKTGDSSETNDSSETK